MVTRPKSGLTLLLGVLVASLISHSAIAQNGTLNEKIVRFCEDHRGQKVGDGECFALANDALHAAGGTRRFKDSPGKGDYVWGELIFTGQPGGSLDGADKILPGDIIQFRDTEFKGKGHSASFGHHTAVVVGVGKEGREVKILQENFSGKKIVTALTLNLNELKKGWIRIYQPLLPNGRRG